MEQSHIQNWVGRSQKVEDYVDLSRVRGMAATFDFDMTIDYGTPLPPAWHWMFFNPMQPDHELGPDGHPKKGGFLPPVELPRRMWAGGRLTFEGDIVVGSHINRISTIKSIVSKEGRSGRLCFVTLRHEVFSNDCRVIDEEQNLVYRELSPAKPGQSPAGPDTSKPEPRVADFPADWSCPFEPTSPMIFRYSALTFNSHRIHYDYPYATQVENYPALVVQGPMLATLLMHLAECNGQGMPVRKLKTFEYRSVAPFFLGQFGILEAAWTKRDTEAKLQIRKSSNVVAVQATATYA